MTAHDLVADLGPADREGRLDRCIKVDLAPKVLIIDEMGCLPLDDETQGSARSGSAESKIEGYRAGIFNRRTGEISTGG